MTGIWTIVPDQAVNSVLAASKINALRDNIDWLKTPPQGMYAHATNTLITATSMADIFTTLSIDTKGGAVLVGLAATASLSTAIGVSSMSLDVVCNGVSESGGQVQEYHSMGAALKIGAGFIFYVAAKAAGTYVYKIQAKVTSGSATIYGIGAGYAPRFWVREA